MPNDDYFAVASTIESMHSIEIALDTIADALNCLAVAAMVRDGYDSEPWFALYETARKRVTRHIVVNPGDEVGPGE